MMEHYLVFQPVHKIFKTPINNERIIVYQSKGLSGESVKAPTTSNNSINIIQDYIGTPKIQVKFDGSCLKQEKLTFTHKTIINFYIVYEINLRPLNLDSKFALLNFLFDAVTLTKNADPDKYSYSGYGIGFDTHKTFSLSDGIGLVKM